MSKPKTTPATVALDAHGADYVLVTYEYDPNAERVGLQAAEAMGVDPGIVFKTLMAKLDGAPVCAIVPSDAEVNMKKLAAALGGKGAEMMKPAEAERLTGFKVGGISPFGQKRSVPTVLEESAELYDEIYINGGQRGVQVRMTPQTVINVLKPVVADISRT
ncbi:Cys-tRNA(Pro)/Cys-tRNA(Cys) deacylase [Devosia pacifica]|uniref:Cys-tRNA(Pro)/Cys-tRNA(Cys) deacylase n=1 Tax=Devosia pacifica TaxID=1335967 RepID=A0A918SAZ0_9HYPH|nr:Cys-tRNA(Pro) deacylase [Devosia pacifica]GHA29726.1 Cys-tRNA(Pro)/Cys-tRNA(Cys) deacylase [Devosia pacifica]